MSVPSAEVPMIQAGSEHTDHLDQAQKQIAGELSVALKEPVNQEQVMAEDRMIPADELRAHMTPHSVDNSPKLGEALVEDVESLFGKNRTVKMGPSRNGVSKILERMRLMGKNN